MCSFSLSFFLKVEEILSGQLDILRARDEHDDLHDDHGPSDERFTPS